MVDLRPLSLGEIVDRSASFWRANWKALFKLYLGFQLGQFALLKAWELAIQRYFPLARGGQRMIEALQAEPQEAFRQLGAGMGGLGVVMMVYVLTGFFSGIAATAYAWPRMIGRTSTLRDSLNRAISRTGTTLGFFGLMIGWTLIVCALWMAPGGLMVGAGAALGRGAGAAVLIALGSLLIMAGGFLALVWFVLRFLLASQVLALEDAGAWGVFKRCATLSSGRVEPGVLGLVKVRLAVMVTVVSLILLVVSLVFGLPALIIQGAYGNVLDPMHATPDAIPQLLMVPAQLLQVVAQSIVGPLFVIFGLVFYADMRVRREGLDLELKLKEGAA
jgi:hypothetical protein